ncbi:MAG TPA: YceI family protein [Gammaproteobacteria bacterium]|nr:YceI family protein [Gammaproteobacteria bacterium]
MKTQFYVLVAIGLCACMKPQITLADCWQSAPNAQNQLQFSVTHQQDVIQGTFTNFTVRFCQTDKNPQKLHVIVATASATTGNSLANAALASDTFLAVKAYPQAEYAAGTFAAENTGFVAAGKLTLHGVTQAMNVFFVVNKKADRLVLQGHAIVPRLAFNIGQDEWQTTKELANEIRLEFKVMLKHQ